MKPVNPIWDEVMKKEARGLNDDDLDEAQNVEGDYVVATAGITDKITYCFPKTLVWFSIYSRMKQGQVCNT
jgi:uncharacterized protein YaiL (DUF2058 family)